MRTVPLLAALAMCSTSVPVLAQNHYPAGSAEGVGPTPASYAGLEKRAIKALSDQDVADLRAGRGMGLALAAELNGYPGPLHVLKLADDLALSPEQRSLTAASLHAMKQETAAIGEEVIAAEAALDGLFADRSASSKSIDAAVARIASAQGRLRAAHLRYHLGTAALLTEDQLAAYDRLSGYGAPHRP